MKAKQFGTRQRGRRRPSPLLDSLKDNRSALPLFLYLRRLSSQQRSQMMGALDLLARYLSDGLLSAATFDWRSLRSGDLPGIGSLIRCFSSRQISRMKRGLNYVCREACKLGDIEESELRQITHKSWMRMMPRTANGGLTTPTDFAAVIAACARDRSARGARDAAMITILWETKAKRADLVALSLSDVHSDHIVLGGCERQVSDAAQSRLAEWRRRRGEMPGPLFLAIIRTGAIETCPITVSSVAWTLRRRIAESESQVAASIEVFQPND